MLIDTWYDWNGKGEKKNLKKCFKADKKVLKYSIYLFFSKKTNSNENIFLD